ncbi:MAG: serine/threonine protein kinase [candidate division KSB1 bacterium]|nr:serine/threonine protein kinase [candidate division KSB1 bacterium]MDZ7365329.1 serine/threonine protein kinase [candidate division KSB1 bacterium]MDZ7403196.1 serine/threonine protein kinase [candidate division KSB1 bacterium]
MNRIGPIQLFAEIKRHKNRVTYRGWDVESGQVVLVKIFDPASLPDEAALARFHQEAAIYAGLSHPNVVRLVKFGVVESRPYLALEFVEGQNLRALLNRRSPLPNDIALCLVHELLSGLAEIHRHDIIHRDLKPENIMIGNDGVVKICDFDLAEARGKHANGNLLFGSPGYLPPEAILGEAITIQSDLFALGIILYEMFTGTRPFAAATASGEMNAVIRLPHLPPSKFNPAIPPQMEQLINRLLAKSPDQRPADAAAVGRQLATQFQISGAAQKTPLLRRYITDPQAFQSEALALPAAKMSVPAVSRRTSITGKIAAAATLLLLAAALSYQQFFSTTAERQAHEPTLASPSRQDDPVGVPMTDSTWHGAPVRGSSPARLTSDRPRSLAQPSEAATAAESPAPRRSRAIVVRSVPWAYLFVNGDSIGLAPRPQPLRLAETTHEFAFKKPGFPTILYAVTIDSATADTLSFSLLEKVAQLEIRVNPWAEIELNGERRESSLEASKFFLLPGDYRVTLSHPQLGVKSEVISLRAGETRRLEVNMFQQTVRE